MRLHAGREEEDESGELIRHTYVCVVRLRGDQKEKIIKRREENKREKRYSAVVGGGAGAQSPSFKTFKVDSQKGLKTGSNSTGEVRHAFKKQDSPSSRGFIFTLE